MFAEKCQYFRFIFAYFLNNCFSSGSFEYLIFLAKNAPQKVGFLFVFLIRRKMEIICEDGGSPKDGGVWGQGSGVLSLVPEGLGHLIVNLWKVAG